MIIIQQLVQIKKDKNEIYSYKITFGQSEPLIMIPQRKIKSNLKVNKPGTYTIKYSVRDGLKKYKRERTVKVLKDELPNVYFKLKGSNVLNMQKGKEYVDLGYKATTKDDKKDLTNNVRIINSINTNKAGEYEVKYLLVYDGKIKTLTRKVVVKGKTEIVNEKGKHQIVIHEIPYEVLKERGIIGNFRHQVDERVGREIKLSEIMAVSSCFPGAFEPMRFPEDFDFYTKEENKNVVDSFSRFEIMDGGIVDNQGVEPLKLANTHLTYDEPAANAGGKTDTEYMCLDLSIISDVANPNVPQDEDWIMKKCPRWSLLRVSSVLLLLLLQNLMSRIRHLILNYQVKIWEY